MSRLPVGGMWKKLNASGARHGGEEAEPKPPVGGHDEDREHVDDPGGDDRRDLPQRIDHSGREGDPEQRRRQTTGPDSLRNAAGEVRQTPRPWSERTPAASLDRVSAPVSLGADRAGSTTRRGGGASRPSTTG